MECVVSSSIIVGGVRCFFFNYCWWSALFLLSIIVGGVSALFLLQLLLVECVVSSLIIVGGVRCFFVNYC